jgi:hypothetical protein
MRYRKLDPNGDYSFGHGLADFYIDVPEAVAQSVRTRLALWTNEWFLDLSKGTPWETQVIGKVNPTVRDQALRSRILNTPGVKTLIKFATALNADTRFLTVTATIDTIFGPVQVTTQIGPVPFTFGTSALGGAAALE